MKRDSQRSAVYRWERTLWECMIVNRKRLSFREQEILIRAVWSQWSNKPLKVVYNPDVSVHRYQHYKRQITLGPIHGAGASMWIPLHEVAHAIECHFKDVGVSHGRVFATLLIRLAEDYLMLPTKWSREIGRLQRPRRVHFAPMGAVEKPQRRRVPWIFPQIARWDFEKLGAIAERMKRQREIEKRSAACREFTK